VPDQLAELTAWFGSLNRADFDALRGQVEHVRHSEMQSISDRMARVGDFPWARAWVTVATLSLGTLLGGLLALIPFLSASPGPSNEAELGYFVTLGVAAIVAMLSGLAAATVHRERAESISAIKADYDARLLGTFEELDHHPISVQPTGPAQRPAP
jgi:hypothetical protein